MIVVDENLHDERILAAIAAWFRGRVVSVTALRPGTVIKDDAIPLLLRKATQPTFVTINVNDFWKSAAPDKHYCIINMVLPKERIREVPDLLHCLFRLPDFKTKALRVGKVIRLTFQRVEYYESDRHIRSLLWPD